MKKIILALMLVVTSFSVFAQKSDYKPYVSVGTSVSSSTITNGAELGIYNDKAWFSVGASEYSVNSKLNWVGSFKTYVKVKTYNIVDIYGYNSVNVSINKAKTLGFEPGIVTVFNVSKKWAPQFSLTAPVYENTNFHFTTLSAGISINYWIK